MIGHIDSIETLGLVDGPGVRVVIFLQGCPLRCLFCHNPETWQITEKLKMAPKEIVDFIKKYKNYFGTDGGVTFSGGEPLYQPEFLLETLKLCKEENIHTCLDTSGVYTTYLNEILQYTDLVILDIKAIEEIKYKQMTGHSITTFLEFLKIVQQQNKPLWIRQVIIPGINDTKEYILELKQFIKPIKNIQKIELLPYHTMGISKYKKLKIPYRLENVEAMDKEKCLELEKLLLD